MKVGLLVAGTAGSGIGNYTSELAKALENQNNVTVDKIHLPTYSVPVFESYISTSYGVMKRLNELDGKYDVFHLSAQTQAAGLVYSDISTPVVVTVHDIIPLVANYDNIILRLFSRLYKHGLTESDRIISISEQTKSDLERTVDYPSEKIDVVYPSIKNSKFNQDDVRRNIDEINISEPYILYVGSQTTKKNIKTVIASLKHLPEEISLVIAGDPGLIPGYMTKYQSIKNGVSERVHQLGFVDLEMLVALYASALAFVFPSKYEGFGRPPLEAMSVGTPVIASTSTAIPEILGDAALYCDPNSSREWAETINQLYSSEKDREKLIISGYDRITKYSWKSCAEETRKIYEEIIL